MYKHINFYIHILSSLLLCFICISCIDEGNADSIINNDDAFKVDMYQSLENPSEDIILNLATLDEYNCTNYIIETIKSNTSKTTEIEFINILPPEVCDVGQGPANGQIIITPILGSNQRIKFFFNDEIVDEAILSDLGESYELELQRVALLKDLATLEQLRL